ncbi:MAG: TIGR04084 family radical SAM/SPASM domain-containing protein [Candidatus Pacearchaeota archaeon]|nr:TIGR04084 family radical SAM/SPASM domain-containing protein [Candidatus Pacearchaeota archaeon]
MFYHIILTERCNSKCTYCYEKSMKEFENKISKKWHFEDSPIDTQINIKKLKNFIEKDKDPHIIFYGGEPLLQIEKIKQIIDNIKAKYYIQTNAKLIDQLPTKYLLKLEKILISIDGNKKRTDQNRGKGTYNKVLQNIKLIRKKGYTGEIVARITLIYPDIFKQVKHLINLNIFNSIHWQIDAGFYENDFNQKQFTKFTKQYNKQITKLINYWTKQIKKRKVLKLYPLLGIFESLYYKTPTKLRCGSGHSNYTITTNGKISACPIMNSIKEFYCGNLNSKKLKQIHCIEPCTKCKYYTICGGRCLYSNHAKLWPKSGEKLICQTIIHLIKQIQKQLPTIKKQIKKRKVKETDFKYLKYFGPEIIP